MIQYLLFICLLCLRHEYYGRYTQSKISLSQGFATNPSVWVTSQKNRGNAREFPGQILSQNFSQTFSSHEANWRWGLHVWLVFLSVPTYWTQSSHVIHFLNNCSYLNSKRSSCHKLISIETARIQTHVMITFRGNRTSMITDRIGRHEVLLPINQDYSKIWERNYPSVSRKYNNDITRLLLHQMTNRLILDKTFSLNSVLMLVGSEYGIFLNTVAAHADCVICKSSHHSWLEMVTIQIFIESDECCCQSWF